MRGFNPRNREQGQGITEYILLMAIVTGMGIALTRGVIGAFDGQLLDWGSVLEGQLRAGRFPINVYRN